MTSDARHLGGGRTNNDLGRGYPFGWTSNLTQHRIFDGGFVSPSVLRIRSQGAAQITVQISHRSFEGALVEWSQVVQPWGACINFQAGSVVATATPDVGQSRLEAIMSAGFASTQTVAERLVTDPLGAVFQPRPFARAVRLVPYGAGNTFSLGFGFLPLTVETLVPDQVVTVAAGPGAAVGVLWEIFA